MPRLSFPRFSQEGTGLGPQVLWLPPRGMPLQSPGSGSQLGLPSQAPQDCNKQTVLNQPPAREQCGSSRQAPVFPGKRPVSASSQVWGRRGGAASAHIPRSLQAVGGQWVSHSCRPSVLPRSPASQKKALLISLALPPEATSLESRAPMALVFTGSMGQ